MWLVCDEFSYVGFLKGGGLEGAFVLFFVEEGVHEREGCVHLVYMDMNLFLRMNTAMNVGT